MSTHKTENSLSKDKREDTESEKQYVHRGMAQRSFTRTWTLAEETEVRSVDLRMGY